MSINRRLGSALLVCARAGVGACDRTARFPAPPRPAAASAPAPPSPDDQVRARAPADELAFLNGKLAFAREAGAGSGAAPAAAQADKAAAWKKIVLGVGQFNDWVGYTKAIDGKGRIEIVLSEGLVVFTGTPKDARFFNVIEKLSENNQLVMISGRFSPSFLGAAEVSDDPKYPTCFENRFRLTGCEIELSAIAPLR